MDMEKINHIQMDWIMMENGLMINHKEMELWKIQQIHKLLDYFKMEKYYKQIKLHRNIKMVSFIKDIFKINCLMEKDLLSTNKENWKLEYSKMEKLFNNWIKSIIKLINNKIILMNLKNN